MLVEIWNAVETVRRENWEELLEERGWWCCRGCISQAAGQSAKLNSSPSIFEIRRNFRWKSRSISNEPLVMVIGGDLKAIFVFFQRNRVLLNTDDRSPFQEDRDYGRLRSLKITDAITSEKPEFTMYVLALSCLLNVYFPINFTSS